MLTLLVVLLKQISAIEIRPAGSRSPSPTSRPTPSPTPRPTPSPTPRPTPSPTPRPTERPRQSGWIDITYDDFEKSPTDSTGWGSFARNVGGQSDADRMARDGQSEYIHQGKAALRLRDNSGIDSSVFHRSDHDVSGYSDLQVLFWFYPRSMGNGDGFFLEYSSNGGSTWSIVKTYQKGRDFENGRFYNDKVVFSRSELNADLTSRGRIRFRCDASSDTDWVYIDEVRFQGYA